MINRPTTIMATNRPAIAGTKYKSAVDCVGDAVGAAVGCAGSTENAVTACVGQYDAEPVNDAYTVYAPAMSGFQLRLKNPSLLVVCPICLKLPFASTTLRVIGTPVVLVGLPFCMYTYSIHCAWLASDTAGTPCGNLMDCSLCFVHAETSVIVPFMVIDVPSSVTTSGAVTVMDVGPLPTA